MTNISIILCYIKENKYVRLFLVYGSKYLEFVCIYKFYPPINDGSRGIVLFKQSLLLYCRLNNKKKGSIITSITTIFSINQNLIIK